MMLAIFFGVLPGFLAYGRHHAYGMLSATFRVGPPSSYPHKRTQKQVAQMLPEPVRLTVEISPQTLLCLALQLSCPGHHSFITVTHSYCFLILLGENLQISSKVEETSSSFLGRSSQPAHLSLSILDFQAGVQTLCVPHHWGHRPSFEQSSQNPFCQFERRNRLL